MLLVLPVHYAPCISWFAAVLARKSVILEQFQHFRKQEYSNRMRIAGPNKIQVLTIPVVRTGENTPFKESRISFAEKWQKNHWKSLETAYRRAPYFEFYEDKLLPLFESQEFSLLHHNLAFIRMLMNILELDCELQLSPEFLDEGEYKTDLRHAFSRKGKSNKEWFRPVPYPQVFGKFESDLSVLDLLFNMGPDARRIVMESSIASGIQSVAEQ